MKSRSFIHGDPMYILVRTHCDSSGPFHICSKIAVPAT